MSKDVKIIDIILFYRKVFKKLLKETIYINNVKDSLLY